MSGMHPDLAITMAKLRHDELTSALFPGEITQRRRFLRRRRDTMPEPVSRAADVVALPPPRDGREVGERRVA